MQRVTESPTDNQHQLLQVGVKSLQSSTEVWGTMGQKSHPCCAQPELLIHWVWKQNKLLYTTKFRVICFAAIVMKHAIKMNSPWKPWTA
jgi:hypothetical protein